MKVNLLFVVVFSGFLVTGCKESDTSAPAAGKQTDSFNIETARKEIDQANLEFIELFNRNDSVGLADMFTSDGKSMEPNEPSFNGRRAIQTHYSIIMKSGTNRLGLKTTGLWGTESMLAEEGEFTFMDKSNRVLDKGKYIVLWKKEDGKWKLFRDCYNSDLAAN